MKKLACLVCLVCLNFVSLGQKEIPFDIQESRVDSVLNDLFLEEEMDLLGLVSDTKDFQFLHLIVHLSL